MIGQESDTQIDWVKEISEGTKSIEDAPMEVVDKFLNAEIEEETPQAVELETEQTEPVIEPVAKVEEVKDEAWFRKKNYELSNALNTQNQQKASHDRKMKEDPVYREQYFREIGYSAPSSSPDMAETPQAQGKVEDVYNEGSLEKLYAKTAELEGKLLKAENEAKARDNSEALEREIRQEQEKTNSRVSTIGEKINSIPSLKTDRPFDELNNLVNLGNKSEESLKAHGVSDSDIQKLTKIYQVANGSDMKQYNDFEYALHKSGYSTQATPATSATLEQAALQLKQQQILGQTPTLSTPTGQGNFDKTEIHGMSEEQAGAFIHSIAKKDPSSFSPTERSNYELAMKALGV